MYIYRERERERERERDTHYTTQHELQHVVECRPRAAQSPPSLRDMGGNTYIMQYVYNISLSIYIYIYMYIYIYI